jgi:COP9 signalosome complex subunit 6
VLASLTTRANAIKMLHSRLTLLQTYLTSLPPSYLTSPTSPTAPTTPPPAPLTSLSHPLLRSILALTARLALLIPADDAAFQHEAEAERSDVALVALLGGMAQSVQGCKELGARFGVVEGLRAGSRKEDRRGWEDTVGGEGAEGAWGDMLRGG